MECLYTIQVAWSKYSHSPVGLCGRTYILHNTVQHSLIILLVYNLCILFIQKKPVGKTATRGTKYYRQRRCKFILNVGFYIMCVNACLATIVSFIKTGC